MGSPPEPERRKLQRFDLRLPAWLMPNGPKNGRKVTVITRDISADGAFFFTNEPLVVGAPVTACVVLPAREGRRQMPDKTGVIFKGQVVRVGMDGVAVCFDRQSEIASLTDGENFLDVASSSRRRRAREVL